jgi:hypothetical protein
MEENGFLTAPYSEEEVQKTIFQIFTIILELGMVFTLTSNIRKISAAHHHKNAHQIMSALNNFS